MSTLFYEKLRSFVSALKINIYICIIQVGNTAMNKGQVRKKGVLLLADVVNFTPQANGAGANKTTAFNRSLESKTRKMAESFRGMFIKQVGDAVLLFFEDETDALQFAIRLRQASQEGELDGAGFDCDLRMVAHYGKFDFTGSGGVLNDVGGAECIVVFRMEKEAETHGVLITRSLLDLLKDDLKDEGIGFKFAFEEVLKGFSLKTEAYRLVFPVKESTAAAGPLLEKMAELERETRNIPVFGDIYPAMSMADNFVDLDIKSSGKESETWHAEEWDRDMEEAKRWRDSFKLREHRKATLPLNVSGLYERFNRGFIFGLPGSGKTTILKYFAFREFKHNHGIEESGKKRTVLFIPCRNIPSYTRWLEGTGTGDAPNAYSIESMLDYLLHCFLSSGGEIRRDGALKKASTAVHRAYYQGRLTLLIDALDEAPEQGVKDNMLTIFKELAAHSDEGKRKESRFFLTARYSEKERTVNVNMAGPAVFDVRSLDMEQLRKMAAYFYRGQETLYREFDRVVWQEEIAAKVGGTPLTALLVIAYFEIFKTFDTRYHMYRVIVVFILVRAWKQIKEGIFDLDLKTFFKEADSAVMLEKEAYGDAGRIFDALTLLSYGYMDKDKKEKTGGRVITEEDILGVFEMFARDLPEQRRADVEKEAEQWLKRLKEDHLLVPAGPADYVFIHSTVMEYLAARYLVEKIKNRGFLEEKYRVKDIAKHMAGRPAGFFESETIPIAAGGGIEVGAAILGMLKGRVDKEKGEARKRMFYMAALKGLAEFENFVERKRKRRTLDFLHKDTDKALRANRKAVEWAYLYIKNVLLNEDKKGLEQSLELFRAAALPRLTGPALLRDFLGGHEAAFTGGDSQLLVPRMELLHCLVDTELADRWLKEREEKIADLLTMDSEGYHPEDKNFGYYREYTENTCTGLLGSPNFRHGNRVTQTVFSPYGKYILSGSYDNTLKLWESATGKEVRTFKGHERSITSIAISGDNELILSGSEDNTLKLWESATGKEVHTFKGHTSTVWSVAFSGDGKHVVSGSEDNTLKLWAVSTGQEVRTFKGHTSTVWSVAFSGDGKHVVSGSSDMTLKLWAVSTGQEVRGSRGAHI
jgi:class 3 adenylate cyclase